MQKTGDELNEKYSFKDFTNQSFIDSDQSEFSNSIIKGSCFAQEVIGNDFALVQVFPDNVSNLILNRCNLDNVLITEGITLIDCSTNQSYDTPNGQVIKRQDETIEEIFCPIPDQQEILNPNQPDISKPYQELKEGDICPCCGQLVPSKFKPMEIE